MNWVREMEQDAVAVAFPDWEWRDDDVVTINQGWEDAGGYSEYTSWDAAFSISVAVRREGYYYDMPYNETQARHASYSNDECAQFWVDLMARGERR